MPVRMGHGRRQSGLVSSLAKLAQHCRFDADRRGRPAGLAAQGFGVTCRRCLVACPYLRGGRQDTLQAQDTSLGVPNQPPVEPVVYGAEKSENRRIAPVAAGSRNACRLAPTKESHVAATRQRYCSLSPLIPIAAPHGAAYLGHIVARHAVSHVWHAMLAPTVVP